MTHLPSLVVETVLKYAAAQGFNTYPEWKTKLRLLSICKEWRYLGKKIIYNLAFISDTAEYSYYSSQALPYISDQTLQSNIGLIQQTNSERHVKKLDLLLIQNDNNFHKTLDLVQKLAFVTNKTSFWKNVRELNIRMFRDDDDDFDENGALAQEVINFSNRLISNLPGIKELYLRKYDSDRTTLLMFNQLAHRYSGQLRYLYSSSALRFSINSNFETLTHLRIPFEAPSNSSSFSLPRISVERLQSLELFNIDASFSWNKLLDSANCPKQMPEFPNLRFLKMVFSIFSTDQSLDNNNTHLASCKPLSISFPNLDTLIVNGNYTDCSRIIIQRYPCQMKKVDLQLNATSLLLMKHVGLKNIDELSISVSASSDSEQDIFYSSTNYFFGNNIGNQQNKQLGPICKNTTLVLNSMSYMLNPQLIAWSDISSITFTGTVHLSVLLKIIKQVQSLEKLVIWAVDMDIDVSTPEKHAQACGISLTQALNVSVKSLSIFDFKKTNSCCIGLNMLNVVLALPQLQRLISAEIVIESVKKYRETSNSSSSGSGSCCFMNLDKIEFIKT